MISERTLRNWRLQALIHKSRQHYPTTDRPGEERNVESLALDEQNERILRLTQEMLDMMLMRRSK